MLHFLAGIALILAILIMVGFIWAGIELGKAEAEEKRKPADPAYDRWLASGAPECDVCRGYWGAAGGGMQPTRHPRTNEMVWLHGDCERMVEEGIFSQSDLDHLPDPDRIEWDRVEALEEKVRELEERLAEVSDDDEDRS